MGTGAAEHRAQGPGDSRSVQKRPPEGRRQVQPTSVNSQLSRPGCSSHPDVATHTHTPDSHWKEEEEGGDSFFRDGMWLLTEGSGLTQWFYLTCTLKLSGGV